MKSPRQWNFDIDRYLNRLVPPPPWNYLPYKVSWFFGHRKPGDQQHNRGNLEPIFWATIGIFCGIALIEGVGLHIPAFQNRDAPLIVGSFGAAAVLEFYAIESPLSQPRNAILGQLISCIVAICIGKLFQLSPNFTDFQWAGGALACALATMTMALTKTVHPPAGATALLAVADDRMLNLGWFLIPIVLLGCGLMLVVALIVNNIGRRFPIYWWTADDLRDGKKIFERRGSPSSSKNSVNLQQEENVTQNNNYDVEAAAAEESTHVEKHEDDNGIYIRPGKVSVPKDLYLRQEERQVLKILSQRL